MSVKQLQKLEGISNLIGNTPILKIKYSYHGHSRTIYAKAEYFNISGSIKDRVAYYIIRKSYEEGRINETSGIYEATSGNTGIAFSAIGGFLGHEVTIFIPDWMSRERIALIRSFGARIRLVTQEEGGFLGSISMAEREAAERGDVFLPRQFDNLYNCRAHYETTGPEIWEQSAGAGFVPDAFVAGVGTGGTIMGAGKYLREKNPALKVYPMEPENSPTLRTGYKIGKHRIQGISDEFIPSILKLDELDEIVSVDDGDAIIMAQRLARELGLGVGISSGANFLAAVKIQNEHPDWNVVTVMADDNKKYLSTDYAKEEPVKDGFLSSGIRLECAGCICPGRQRVGV